MRLGPLHVRALPREAAGVQPLPGQGAPPAPATRPLLVECSTASTASTAGDSQRHIRPPSSPRAAALPPAQGNGFFGHTAPDADAFLWQVGGRVSLTHDGHTTVDGEITEFDARSGYHTITAANGMATQIMLTYNRMGLLYTPPPGADGARGGRAGRRCLVCCRPTLAG